MTDRARPHRSALIEDAVKARIAVVLRRLGWRPLAVAYTGYGSAVPDGESWVRIMLRVRLGPARARSTDDTDRKRWWRKFFTVGLADVPVQVRVGAVTHEITSRRGGYVDTVLPADLAGGWHDATVTVEGRTPLTVGLRVVGPDERLGLISDIDDTVMITALPRPLVAFWNTFLVKGTNRRPVPGMADLYDRLRTPEPQALVVYLSTGAWNVAPAIAQFLDRTGYPPGPLLMTDWGPTTQGWFRSGYRHKHRELRRLVSDLPQLRWVLIGDDGQHDPQLFEELVQETPDAVRMVLVRRLSMAEQILTRGSLLLPQDRAAQTPEVIPWLHEPDGTSLAARLTQLEAGAEDTSAAE